jgi:SAM domain (Sterile alpha motif).
MALGKKNVQDKQTAAMASSNTPIIIQMPPFQYPYSNLNNSDTPIPPSATELPSIHEFFSSLDEKHNSNTYSKFVNNFVEEEITVDLIKDLSNEEMEKLGIVKIGWKKNIRQAAQKY